MIIYFFRCRQITEITIHKKAFNFKILDKSDSTESGDMWKYEIVNDSLLRLRIVDIYRMARKHKSNFINYLIEVREYWSMNMIDAYNVSQEGTITKYTIHILHESQYRD